MSSQPRPYFLGPENAINAHPTAQAGLPGYSIAYHPFYPSMIPCTHIHMPQHVTHGMRRLPNLRKGKWTPEELKYTNRVIETFNAGTLQLPEATQGTTLRSYLADKLGCDPMRITKKYTGTECLGKRVYHPDVCKDLPEELLTSVKREIEELEAAFLEKLSQTNRDRRDGMVPGSDFHPQMISTPAIDAMMRGKSDSFEWGLPQPGGTFAPYDPAAEKSRQNSVYSLPPGMADLSPVGYQGFPLPHHIPPPYKLYDPTAATSLTPMQREQQIQQLHLNQQQQLAASQQAFAPCYYPPRNGVYFYDSSAIAAMGLAASPSHQLAQSQMLQQQKQAQFLMQRPQAMDIHLGNIPQLEQQRDTSVIRQQMAMRASADGESIEHSAAATSGSHAIHSSSSSSESSQDKLKIEAEEDAEKNAKEIGRKRASPDESQSQEPSATERALTDRIPVSNIIPKLLEIRQLSGVEPSGVVTSSSDSTHDLEGVPDIEWAERLKRRKMSLDNETQLAIANENKISSQASSKASSSDTGRPMSAAVGDDAVPVPVSGGDNDHDAASSLLGFFQQLRSNTESHPDMATFSAGRDATLPSNASLVAFSNGLGLGAGNPSGKNLNSMNSCASFSSLSHWGSMNFGAFY